MIKKQICLDNLEAVGPYSVAMQVGPSVLVSGQMPLDENGNLVSEDISIQTKKVIEHIEMILKNVGMSLEDVVKTTVYLKDLEEFELVNQTYAIYFAHPYPVRSCVEVSNLPKNARIKIDCVAVEAKSLEEEDCSGCCCNEED